MLTAERRGQNAEWRDETGISDNPEPGIQNAELVGGECIRANELTAYG